MEAKQFLKQYQVTRARIRNMEAAVQDLEDLLLKITAETEGDRVQTSGPKDRVGDLLSRIVDYRNEIMDQWKIAIDQLADIDRVIRRVDDGRLQRILFMRYVDYRKWEAIAADLHIDYRWTLRLHGKALEKVEKIIN